MHLGRPENNDFDTSSQARTRGATNFGGCPKQIPLCGTTPCEVQPPLKSMAMDVKELPRWTPSERVKTQHVLCEGSSLHAVVPFEDNDTETSQTLQRQSTDAGLRPYMRPHWLKVDPYRAQISEELMNWCRKRGIEVVDAAGKVKEQQGKVEHHAQLFELTLEDVLQPVVSFWCLAEGAGIRAQTRDPGEPPEQQSGSDREQFVSLRLRRWTRRRKFGQSRERD